MKLIVSSDWQLSLNNLDRAKLFVDQVIDILKESSKKHNCFFLHCGDVKEHWNPIDQRVTNFILESFKRIKDNCTNIIFIRGNHDSITTQDGVPSCIPLLESLGITVADQSWILVPIRLLTWNSKIVKYALVYLVPFFRDPVRQKAEFSAAYHSAMSTQLTVMGVPVSTESVKILAFHNTITGSKQSLYTKGEGVSIEELGAKHYDICVGGHIHLPQFIKPNIYYVGSPFPMDFGEVNVQHRLLVLTIDEDSK
jgi:DNA repair exonuclease SbcCD nuclease subunit